MGKETKKGEASMTRRHISSRGKGKKVVRMRYSIYSEEEVVTVYNMKQEVIIPREEPLRQVMRINGMKIHFEVDTGCSYTIMSKKEFKKLGKQTRKPKLGHCKINLRTYSGHPVPVMGAAYVKVEYKGLIKSLPVVVARGSGPSLVGRGWIQALEVDWQRVNKVTEQEERVHNMLTILPLTIYKLFRNIKAFSLFHV